MGKGRRKMDEQNQAQQPQATQPTMGQEAQPQMEQQPQEQGNIPYARFKEVIAQKNQLAAQLASLQQQPQTQAVQNEVNTVEDLLSVVQKLVDTRLNEAYETKVKPVESYVQNSQFNANVERYFSDPKKAEVRAEMDAYTATLDPESQRFLKAQLVNGNTRMLDAIFYQIQAERGHQVQTQAQAQTRGMAEAAAHPMPFKTIRTGEPSLGDIKQSAIQTGDFKNFFHSIAPKG